jgi:hypothetical protein
LANIAVKQWDTATVIGFLIHSGFGEYANTFKENQIVGHNLLTMKDHDYRDLGIKAQGHIIKFREAISKLMKINERQSRNKRLKNRLKLQAPKKEQRNTQIIRWDSTVIDENDADLDESGGGDIHEDIGTDCSHFSTKRSISSEESSDKKKLGSIDISVKKIPKKNSADLILERRSSNESVLSLDNVPDPKRERKSSFQLPLSPSQLASSSWMIYDSNKPKLKRAMSFVKEEEDDHPAASLTFDNDLNIPDRKSTSK